MPENQRRRQFEFLIKDKSSIVLSSQRQAWIECYIPVGEHCPCRCYEARSRGQSLARGYNPSNHKPDFILFMCQGWDGPKSNYHEESDQRLDLILLCILR